MSSGKTKKAKTAKVTKKGAKIPINPVKAGENFAENIGKKFGWEF